MKKQIGLVTGEVNKHTKKRIDSIKGFFPEVCLTFSENYIMLFI